MAGRPKKLDLLNGSKKGKLSSDGKVFVRHASKESIATVKKVLKEYEKDHDIMKASKRAGVSHSTFYYHINTYQECKKLANEHGIGLRNDADVVIKNAKRKIERPPDSAFSIFDLPTRKAWTDEQKQEAINRTMEALKAGVPFGYAVRYAGLSPKMLTEWVTTEPGLLDVLLQAEAHWCVTFFKCLTKAAVEAANKGKFLEIVQGAERRFAQQWGQVQSIDLTLKNQQGEEHILTLDKNKINSSLDAEIEAELGDL